ncbi:MAG: hypothetical protein ACK5EO_00730 [Planctomycetota bacterium]
MLTGLKSKFETACVAVLMVSGMVHAALFVISDRAWEDPLSFRKATLFGLSTGLTLWSCLWASTRMNGSKYDKILRNTLCGSLVLEVFLITLQTWRGELSHFNHIGVVNGLIELSMLVLITLAVVAMFVLTYRAWRPASLVGSSISIAWAIRWGLLLLSVSALVGYGITWVGQEQMVRGLSPTHFKVRGVLKFPHGAALHAIQTLAVVAWFTDRMRIKNSVRIIHCLAAAHGCWLGYALYQTFAGLDRFELSTTSLLLLAATILCGLATVASAIFGRTNNPVA